MSTAILKLPEVMRRTGLSRSSIYKLASEQKFPPPVKLSERSSGFVEQEIESWLSERIANSRPASKKGGAACP